MVGLSWNPIQVSRVRFGFMRNAFPALFRVVGIAMFCLVSAMAIALTPVHLKCEYQTKPLGVDTIRPRLAWWFDSSRRGEIQTAYQVVVASSAAKLKAGKYDLWNSKKIQSGQSTQVEYEGKELKSNIECLWKVRVWDRDGKVSGVNPLRGRLGFLNRKIGGQSGLRRPTNYRSPSRPPSLATTRWSRRFRTRRSGSRSTLGHPSKSVKSCFIRQILPGSTLQRALAFRFVSKSKFRMILPLSSRS